MTRKLTLAFALIALGGLATGQSWNRNCIVLAASQPTESTTGDKERTRRAILSALEDCEPLVRQMNDRQQIRDQLLAKLKEIALEGVQEIRSAVQEFLAQEPTPFDTQSSVIYLLDRYLFNVPKLASSNGAGLMPGTPHNRGQWNILWPFTVDKKGRLELRQGLHFGWETRVDLLDEFDRFSHRYGLRRRGGYQ